MFCVKCWLWGMFLHQLFTSFFLKHIQGVEKQMQFCKFTRSLWLWASSSTRRCITL
ncbi:hypothetical protein GYH30_036608 [Glycine max]|nr:hypothetical protein GYH30_036608 [Glycine max]